MDTPCKFLILVVENHAHTLYTVQCTLLVVESIHLCTSKLLVVERHPYTCWWEDTLNVHTAAGGKTPRTYILLQPQQMESLLQWWRQSQYVLHVLTVGDGNTPWMSILLVVEGHPARQYCYW